MGIQRQSTPVDASSVNVREHLEPSNYRQPTLIDAVLGITAVDNQPDAPFVSDPGVPEIHAVADPPPSHSQTLIDLPVFDTCRRITIEGKLNGPVP